MIGQMESIVEWLTDGEYQSPDMLSLIFAIPATPEGAGLCVQTRGRFMAFCHRCCTRRSGKVADIIRGQFREWVCAKHATPAKDAHLFSARCELCQEGLWRS